MKNNNKKACFSIIISFLMVALYVVTPISHAKHPYNNEVRIQSSDGSFNRVTFHEIDHSISSKQPYDGIYYAGIKLYSPFSIVIKAGRHGSRSVARQFNNWVHHENTSGDSPKKLNFAVKGTLSLWKNNTLVARFNEIVLAQGSAFINNLWWLGAVNSCKYEARLQVLICTSDTANTQNKWFIKASLDTSYSFTAWKGDALCSNSVPPPNIP